MVKKIDVLRGYMTSGDWKKAISLAAKFPRLGAIRNTILDAQMAYTNPRFVMQIGKDPNALISAGIAALQEKYQKKQAAASV